MIKTFAAKAAADSALATQPTANSTITSATLSETSLMAASLTADVGWARSKARLLNEDFNVLHRDIQDAEWRVAASDRCKESVATMLGELADRGFAWRDIARLVNVSVPAVQKWRKGERASGDSRWRVASLLAACDLISDHYMVDEIASWFETPLALSAPVTPITLYAADRADLVFELASGNSDPEMLLLQFDPDWRERYLSDFEVFEAGDGNRSIRMKS